MWWYVGWGRTYSMARPRQVYRAKHYVLYVASLASLCDETIHFFFENSTFKVALYCMKPLFKCEFIFLPHSHFGRFFGKIEHIPKSSSKHYEN